MKRFIIITLVLVIIAAAGYSYLIPKVQRKYRGFMCASGLYGLGKIMLHYNNDHDGNFPTPTKWCDLLDKQEAETITLFLRCRGASEGPCNYAMNKEIPDSPVPPDIVVLFETHPGWNQSGGPEILTTDYHEGEGCNILFADSHVKFVKTEDLGDLKWHIENIEAEKP
jgi:prepilin-type processing-associated H-X9-DG protein